MNAREKITTNTFESKRADSTTKKAQGSEVDLPTNSPVGQILYLQRTIGNHVVQRLIKSGALQTRFKIGQPNDIYEQEADRVAYQVMRAPQETPLGWMPKPPIQRQEEKREKEEEKIQTKPLAAQITPLVQHQAEEAEEEESIAAKGLPGQTPEVSPDLESSIQSLKGGGQPLDTATRAYFEPRFGYDFSHVRVHSKNEAAEAAQQLNAKAFTRGKDVIFGPGRYQPQTPDGQRLLAHELAHVVQNSSAVFGAATSVHKADEAPPASPPPLTAADIEISYGPNADSSVVSSKTIEVIKDILVAANEKTATISSTQRDSTAQARAMYNNLESEGVAAQKALYGANGDLVIDEYEKLKGEGKTPDQIKAGMKAKIDELGPSTVSKHCADQTVLGVVDIAPISIEHKTPFETAAEAAKTSGKVNKFLKPPDDPGYHLEIPQA